MENFIVVITNKQVMKKIINIGCANGHTGGKGLKMKTKKYELTNEAINHAGRILYRIKALMDFETVLGTVKAGDLGGFVGGGDNLSHNGTAWIYNDAKVYDNAIVAEDAVICDYAEVYDYAVIYGCAEVHNHAVIHGHAAVLDCARIYDNADVRDWVNVGRNITICGDTILKGNIILS